VKWLKIPLSTMFHSHIDDEICW